MIGWRMHLGVIFPTPTPARVIREIYEVLPDGVDVTIATLSVRALTREELSKIFEGAERAAEQLARYDVDMVYQSGVPPLAIRGPGCDRELVAKMEKASGLPACTDFTGVMEAFRALSLKRLVMATPFEDDMNGLIRDFLKPEGFEIVHMKGLQIVRNADIRKLPIPVEYTHARQAFRESPQEPDGIYIPCGGWGSVHNIQRLEHDLGKPVVTWLQAMLWYAMRRMGVHEPIRGFGKLLETL